MHCMDAGCAGLVLAPTCAYPPMRSPHVYTGFYTKCLMSNLALQGLEPASCGTSKLCQALREAMERHLWWVLQWGWCKCMHGAMARFSSRQANTVPKTAEACCGQAQVCSHTFLQGRSLCALVRGTPAGSVICTQELYCKHGNMTAFSYSYNQVSP